MTHRHDYEMHFENPDRPLDFVLRCKCGDVAPDISTALERMSRSRGLNLLWWLLAGVAIVLTVLLYAEGYVS
jgi:hypothetical protein